MKITRVIGAAATAVMTTGVLTAVGVPASAQELLNPDMVPAMQRDLGLSHDQALSRLQSEDAAGKVAAAVAATLGDTLGGVTYNAATGKAHIETTNAALLGKIRESGAEAELVKYSARQLDSTVDVLNRGERTASAAITSWGVDTATNRVTLTVLQGQRSAADAFIAKSGVDGSAVTVVETAEKPSLHYNVRGGDAYYIGGAARCSIGFSVNGGFLSAGHCAALTGGGALTGYNNVALGSFSRYSFPTKRLAPGRYAMRIRAVGYELDSPEMVTVTNKGAVADLKSAYTRGHAAGVAERAAAAGRAAGLTDAEVRLLRRAGWLHDLGRVGVSARVPAMGRTYSEW